MSNIVSHEAQRSGRLDRFDLEERALGDYLEYPECRREIEATINVFDLEYPGHREAFIALKRGAVTPFDLVCELVDRGKLDKLGIHVGGVVGCIRSAASPTVSTALDAARALRAASEE